MGRSRKAFFVAVAAALPALVACNAILGIDDFRRVDCVGVCEEDDGGPDQIVIDNFVPDNRVDTGPDAPPGDGPVSWAAFPMPNYKPDSGAPVAPTPLAYTPNDADQVTDVVTELVWRRAVIGAGFGTDFSIDDARGECQKITTGGPWRLPKRIELVTLLSHGNGAPFIDTDAFTGVKSTKVWSSSEVRPFNGKYWAVDFETGSVVQLDSKSSGAKVLCVKDKQ